MVDKRAYSEKPLKDLFTISKKNIKPKNSPNKRYYHYSIPAYDNLLEPELQKGEEVKSNKYYLDKDSILVSKLNPRIKRVWKYNHIEDNKAFCSTEFMVYQPNSPEINLNYYYQYFHSDVFQNSLLQLQSGSTGSRMRVSPNDTLEIPVPVPRYLEQRKIAAILTSVDDAIEKTEAIIAQAKKVKKGLMQKLLTQGIGHTKFKQTEIGEVPEEWEVKKIGSVLDICQYGLSSPLNDNSANIPVLRMNNLKNGVVNLNELRYTGIPDSEAKNFLLEKDDILFNRTNSQDLVGKTAIFKSEFKCLFASYLIRLRTSSVMYQDFLNFYMNSHLGQSRIRKYITKGVSQSNINASNLKEVLLPVPSLIEQNNIINILSSVDNKITAEQQKLTQLQTLKKGLMQVLLTGKVRVKVDEENEVVST